LFQQAHCIVVSQKKKDNHTYNYEVEIPGAHVTQRKDSIQLEERATSLRVMEKRGNVHVNPARCQARINDHLFVRFWVYFDIWCGAFRLGLFSNERRDVRLKSTRSNPHDLLPIEVNDGTALGTSKLGGKGRATDDYGDNKAGKRAIRVGEHRRERRDHQ
jgi:hypothetical protein